MLAKSKRTREDKNLSLATQPRVTCLRCWMENLKSLRCWFGASAIRFVVVLSLFLLTANLSRPTSAQGSHCDPNLQQTGGDPNGYRLRGDRCEGVYVRGVGGTTVVVSLTEYVEDFNPAASRSLRVEWTAPGNGNVRLRAYSLRHRLYYQMDSLRPTGNSSYDWPTDLLSALKLTKGDLGIVALTSYQVGNSKREVYLPVRIKQQSATGKSSGNQLVLLPDTELDNVFISLAPVMKDGSLGASIKNWALGRGFYPAGRGIKITIPQVKIPGMYFLKVGATFKAGGSSTKEVWFYQHSD